MFENLIASYGDELSNFDKELMLLILTLLCSTKVPDKEEIDPILLNDSDFIKLYNFIMDLRELSGALNRGDLQKFVYSKGFVLANLKALQSNLRHLTWQTVRVAEGDFSQKVEFLGEFSESFNQMTNKLKSATNNLTKLAELDSLTQIPNRLSLNRFLNNTFADSKLVGETFSLISFDLDKFKNVNDSFGHDAGDAVLIAVSRCINEQFRSSDFFGRYGGEEFLAILPKTSMDVAVKIAKRTLEKIANLNIVINENDAIKVTISAGISEIKNSDLNVNTVMKRSDIALYEAKNTGRNKVCCK